MYQMQYNKCIFIIVHMFIQRKQQSCNNYTKHNKIVITLSIILKPSSSFFIIKFIGRVEFKI